MESFFFLKGKTTETACNGVRDLSLLHDKIHHRDRMTSKTHTALNIYYSKTETPHPLETCSHKTLLP